MAQTTTKRIQKTVSTPPGFIKADFEWTVTGFTVAAGLILHNLKSTNTTECTEWLKLCLYICILLKCLLTAGYQWNFPSGTIPWRKKTSLGSLKRMFYYQKLIKNLLTSCGKKRQFKH